MFTSISIAEFIQSSQILLNQLLPLFVLSNSDENQNPFLQHSTKALQRE